MEEIKTAAREKFNTALDDITNSLKSRFDKVFDEGFSNMPPMPDGLTTDEIESLKQLAVDMISLTILKASLTGAAEGAKEVFAVHSLQTLQNFR